MQIDGTGATVLDDDESMRLLAGVRMGRVALTRDALRVILPVAFQLVGRDPVIRTGPGAVREAGRRRSVLCLEADGCATDWSSGWSVLVTGRAELLTEPHVLAVVRRLALPDWRRTINGDDHDDIYVRIRTELISGRRFETALATRGGTVPA